MDNDASSPSLPFSSLSLFPFSVSTTVNPKTAVAISTKCAARGTLCYAPTEGVVEVDLGW